MYRCIIAPVDQSQFGEHAIPLAAAIARQAGVPLDLVHVHVPLIAPSGVEAVTFRGAWSEVTRAQSRDYLAELERRVARTHSIRVISSLLEGPVAEAVSEHAIRCGAGLVVMSTHAHRRLARLWHHGTAEHVTRSLPVPVLLIRPRMPDEAPDLSAAKPIRHVLVPLDGSPYAEAMVPHAAELGGLFDATFTLLQVVKPEFEIGYTLLGQDGHVNQHRLEQARRAALANLDIVARRMRKRGLTVRTRVEIDDEPATAIVNFARYSESSPEPVDVIAMEMHPHRPISRILGVHTADAVLHESPVPVLVFEPSLRAQPQNVGQPAISEVRA